MLYVLFNPLIPLISQRGCCQISGISELFFLFAYIIYIGYGQIYPHLLHFPHPRTGGHAAIYSIWPAHLGAGSVRCAGKKIQKTIYIVKSAAQSMSNFRGEATERNYSLSKFRQWPSGGNCLMFLGKRDYVYRAATSSVVRPVAFDISAIESPIAFRLRATSTLFAFSPSAHPSAFPSSRPFL